MNINSKLFDRSADIEVVTQRSIFQSVSVPLKFLVSVFLISLCFSSFAEELAEDLQNRAVEFARAAYKDIKADNMAPDHLEEIWERLFKKKPIRQVTDDEIEKIADKVAEELKSISDDHERENRKEQTLTDDQIDTARQNTYQMLMNRKAEHGGI